MKILLSPSERKALKAQAHALAPVVWMGNEGLSPSVVREIDRALAAHELVKVRAPTDDRAERSAWFEQVADQLSAAPVQHIGKILVFWRLNPELEAARKAKATPKPARKGPRLTKRQEEQRALKRRNAKV